MPGIEQTKDLLLFVAKLGNAIGKSTEDGVVDFSDALELLPVIPSAFSALVGSGDIPEEVSDLSDEEHVELVEAFKAEFDLSQDGAEKAVEAAMDVLLKLVKLALSFGE